MSTEVQWHGITEPQTQTNKSPDSCEHLMAAGLQQNINRLKVFWSASSAFIQNWAVHDLHNKISLTQLTPAAHGLCSGLIHVIVRALAPRWGDYLLGGKGGGGGGWGEITFGGADIRNFMLSFQSISVSMLWYHRSRLVRQNIPSALKDVGLLVVVIACDYQGASTKLQANS